ncbi:MAG: ABC transporter permease [Chloroflexi bacterium]|nr:ABC transporter permease [Chloroflexota bacterium]
MSIAFRKVWRDLWNHKGRTFLVVISIAVGVMALGMTTASNTLLKREMAESRLARRRPDARLSFIIPLNDDAVQAVAAMPEVAQAEGRISANIRWAAVFDGEWKDGLLTVSPDYEHQVFDLLELKNGAWPGPDEIAVEVSHQASYGVPPIGEMMYVQVNNRALPLKIVGALRDPLQLPPPYNAINKTAFYVSRDTAEHILGTRDFNQLGFTVPAYSEANVQKAAKAVQDKLKRLGILSATTTFSLDIQDPTGDQVGQFMDGLGLVLIVMAFFSLALSATLVINTINAIVAQQVTQIGIMKTIGGLYWQIVTLYLAGVAVYGLLSLVVAVPIGALSGYYLSAFWLTAFNVPVAPFEILPESFLYQAGVGLLTPLVAALWPVFQGVSIPVRQAIAAYGLGTGRYGSKWLDKVMGQVQGFPRMATLALRNTFRRAGRVALTEITLLSAGAIFMMVVATGNSFNQTIDNVWSNWGFDVVFVFKNYQRIAEVEQVIWAQPGVNQVEMWAWVQATAHLPGRANPGDQYDIQLRGIPRNTRWWWTWAAARKRRGASSAWSRTSAWAAFRTRPSCGAKC